MGTLIQRPLIQANFDVYEQMLLNTYEFPCHVKGKKFIDHISTNMNKIKTLHSDVLPFTTVYFYDTDGQLDMLNKLILTAIDKHTPLVRKNLPDHQVLG